MSFRRTLEFFIYASVLWAFASLAFFAHLHLIPVLVFVLAVVARMIRGTGRMPFSPLFWLAASAIVLAASFYGWFIIQERLYTVVYLFLYLQLNKLWTWEKNRDLLQLFGLTFFHMLAAAVSTQSVLFAPVLAVYLFLVLGGLITLTLKKDAEKAFRPAGRRRGELDAFAPVIVHDSDQRRLHRIYEKHYFDARFMRSVTTTLLLILGIGMSIFYVIPRMQARSFVPAFASVQAGRSQSGYSDTVELSSAQQIELDPTVAMRAYPIEGFPMHGNQPMLPYLRLRGSTLDNYDGRRWTRSQSFTRRAATGDSASRRIIFDSRDALPGERRLVTGIEMEPYISPLLFGPDEVQGYVVEGSSPTFRLDRDARSARALGNAPTRVLRYRVESIVPDSFMALAGMGGPAPAMGGSAEEDAGEQPADVYTPGSSPQRRLLDTLFRLWNPATSGLTTERLPRELEEIYLDLPEHRDLAAVNQLAKEWAEGLQGDWRIAKELELSLKRNFEYSLSVPFSNREDHLTQFLTDARAGHCEYFATAMTLMLRTKGIPSRMVTGYASDEWVDADPGYYLVRQEHAHVWVEAYLDGMGWTAFDPTPASGIGGNRIPNTWTRRVARFLDDIRLAWYRTVIDFDAGDQEGMYRTLITALANLHTPADLFAASPEEEERSSRGLMVLLSFVGAAFLGVLLAREVWLRLARPAIQGEARTESLRRGDDRVRDYLRLLGEIEKRIRRTPSETPLEFARKVARREEPLSGFVDLTKTYYVARFDGAIWAPADSERANALLRHLRTASETPRVPRSTQAPSS